MPQACCFLLSYTSCIVVSAVTVLFLFGGHIYRNDHSIPSLEVLWMLSKLQPKRLQEQSPVAAILQNPENDTKQLWFHEVNKLRIAGQL